MGGLDDKFNGLGDSIDDRGWATGFAQTGRNVPEFPFGYQFHAVLWNGRHFLDLDTLPGGRFGLGVIVNDAGQVIGFSDNGVPDPFAGFFFPTDRQLRTFVWETGCMEDIGTLGGPDATPGPGCDNQRAGVIVASSYVTFTPNLALGSRL